MNKTLKKIWYDHCSRSMGFPDERFANELNDIQKQLDALEIIKKCCVLKENYQENSAFGLLCTSEITKEQFDLVKEALESE